MKNLSGFFYSSDLQEGCFQSLNVDEMLTIRGGAEPVKPITPPRDRFDEEEQ